MKDKLERFIDQNRTSFDDKEPAEKVWSNVEQSLPSSRKNLWNSLTVWRSAAVIFMALSAYLFIPRISGGGEKNEQVLREFNDVEEFYIQQIADKVQLIGQFRESDGLNGFTQDFHQLEAMYMVLKEEMKARPSKKVKDALVLNLLVRIDLLNQQLHKLDQGEEGDMESKDEEESNA